MGIKHIEPHDKSDDLIFVLDLATFISASFCFVISLLSRVLADFTFHSSHRLSNIWIAAKILLIEMNSRKRKRDDATALMLPLHFLSMLKSYLLFYREITNPWYIKPRSFNWCALYIAFVPLNDHERFRQFFRIFYFLFHYICSIVHVHMVTKPPHGLAGLLG